MLVKPFGDSGRTWDLLLFHKPLSLWFNLMGENSYI